MMKRRHKKYEIGGGESRFLSFLFFSFLSVSTLRLQCLA